MKPATVITVIIGNAETQRQQVIYTRRERELHAQSRINRLRRISTKLQKLLIFLAGAGIVWFVVAHRTEIHSLATQNISRMVVQMQTKNATSSFRQSGLNHEQEVNEITR